MPPRSQPRDRSVAALLLGVVAVSIALALVTGLFAEQAPARVRPPEPVRLVQFNMCGHACNDEQRQVAGAVEALAGDRPAAAGLDEVCRGQLRSVVAGLRSHGWAMHARFLVTAPAACGGDDYGIAVLIRSPVLRTDALTYRRQSPGTSERRGLVCALAVVAGRPTRVCSTHLVSAGEDPTSAVRGAQAAEAARLAGSSRRPGVLMGDFNLTPRDPGMAALYSSAHGGGSGALDEVGQGRDRCRCGTPTHGGGVKLDYAFVTARDFAVRGARVVGSATSDHSALWATVTAR